MGKLLALSFLLATAMPTPVLSSVIAEGAVSNGFYYQKIRRQDGRTQYICRSTTEGRIQKHSSCDNAGAKRPN